VKAYNKYKKTSEFWLPSMPDNWENIKIKHIFKERVEKGYPDKPLLAATQNMGVVPKNVYGNRTVEALKDLHLLKLVKIGDFVISLRSFQGGIEYAYYEGIISPAYTVMIPDENNSNFFRYLFKSIRFIELLQNCVTGIREGQNIDYSKLREHLLPIPPRPEQDQIVSYLDWKVSMINKYINAKKKQIEFLKEYFSKKITDFLFEDVTSFLKMKYLTEYKLQYGANASGIDFNDKYPRYIRITDINNDGTLNNDSVLSLNIPNYEDYLLKNGDILFARSGATVGKTFMYKDEYGKCCFAGYLIRITPNKKVVLPEYLYYYTLSSNYIKWLKQVFIQATIQNISAEKYKELIIPYRLLEKQSEIVLRIQSEEKKNKIFIKNIEKEIQLLQEYRIRLISDVVTGKVNVQNVKVPEFESVETLDILDSDE